MEDAKLAITYKAVVVVANKGELEDKKHVDFIRIKLFEKELVWIFFLFKTIPSPLVI